jgi:galactokinase
VTVPPEFAFVVASSGQRAAKGGAVRDRYNELVLAARLAALLLGERCGRPGVTVLGALGDCGDLAPTAEELPLTASLSDIDVDPELDRLLPPGFDRHRPVAVRAAARHAISEARRVDLVEAALARHSIDDVGAALRGSHVSLRDELRCSTPALDALCAAMEAAGAAGARLTGAGFGGYAVAVTMTDLAATVIDGAVRATGGPAFVAEPSQGVQWS